jgi:ABC-type methionine transport system permease subunit
MDPIEPPPVTNKTPGLPLLDAVLDWSFATAITPRIVKWLYIISIVAAALIAFSKIVAGFALGIMTGLVSLFVAPVVFIAHVLAARVILEVAVAIFQIADSLKNIEIDIERPR